MAVDAQTVDPAIKSILGILNAIDAPLRELINAIAELAGLTAASSINVGGTDGSS